MDFIGRDTTRKIQAIAVVLMVVHHLFAFPDRIASSYVLLFDFEAIHLTTMIAYFGRICIAIFAFLSGYGWKKKMDERQNESENKLVLGYRMMVKQGLGFYVSFWLVGLLFVGYGMGSGIYVLTPKELVKTFLGLSYVCNQEWWYILYYLYFLALFPLLNWLLDQGKKCKVGSVLLVAMSGCMLVVCLAMAYLGVSGYLPTLVVFWIGMWMAAFSCYERGYRRLKNCGIWGNGIVWLMLLVILFVRSYISQSLDFILAPVFIFCIIWFLKSKYCGRVFHQGLALVGGLSTYIWLIHTFLGYYFFQDILYRAKYGILIGLICIGVCMGIGYLLEYVRIRLTKYLVHLLRC